MRRSSAVGTLSLLVSLASGPASVTAQIEEVFIGQGSARLDVTIYDDGRDSPYEAKIWTSEKGTSTFVFDAEARIKTLSSDSEIIEVTYTPDGSVDNVTDENLSVRSLLGREDDSKHLRGVDENVKMSRPRRLDDCSDCQDTLEALCTTGAATTCALLETSLDSDLAALMCNLLKAACTDLDAEASCSNVCDTTVTGDPHVVGFSGQKFDFSGEDGAWYAFLKDEATQVNMRMTAPVPGLEVITYITGMSIATKDNNGVPHTMVIFVSDPEALDSRCPSEASPCIADGALKIILDGVEISSPSQVVLGPSVSFGVVNIPGECRPFGFEKYYAAKARASEAVVDSGRRNLREQAAVPMSKWIIADKLATNKAECSAYVERSSDENLFSYLSEHAAFQLTTPAFVMRLNYGKLHQVAMRDPTGQFDLPDHVTHQMNVGLSRVVFDQSPQGVLGETTVVRKDANGEPIMHGQGAIAGTDKDYEVEHALGTTFLQFSS